MVRSDECSLEAVVGRALQQRRLALALAESCTGGLVSHRITNVPGISAVYLGGVVSYADEVKVSILGVQPSTLARHGAVSEPVAREMAQGVRQLLGADVALSITGIAGPGGGSAEKPVGLVFIGLATPQGVRVEQHEWAGDREANKRYSADAALDLLRRYLES